MKIEKILSTVKPFVGSLAGKHFSRPILKTAFINENHVIATNSHILIRMKHNESIASPYIHHYTNKTEACTPEQYPNVDRIIPHPYDAQNSFGIDVNEWLEAHDLALVAAKQHKQHTTILTENIIKVNAPTDANSFNEISFKYTLDSYTPVEEVGYNCEYMLTVLKTLKKLKHKTVTCYYYGQHRPMLFIAEDLEIILLPIRINK